MKANDIICKLKSLQWTRHRVLGAIGCALVVLCIAEFYSIWLSRTKIAFVNFQPIALQGFSQANNNPMISLNDVSTKDIEQLDGFDIIFVNGMGLNITAEQRQYIRQLAEKGKPVYTTMATNPDNNISNLTTNELVMVQEYMMYGGKKNYRSLLSFIRHNIDGKIIFTGIAEKPQSKPNDYLYYPSEKGSDDENEFLTIADYEKFMHTHGLWHNGAPKIIVTGQITDPSDLIIALAKMGKYNIYPIASMTMLQNMLRLYVLRPLSILPTGVWATTWWHGSSRPTHYFSTLSQ